MHRKGMAKDICTRCGTANDDGAKFCEGCGANLAPQVACPTCHAANPLGRRFCTRCGGSLEGSGWSEAAQPGAVVDGVWERGDELIRRVDPEEARRFLGTRSVRVPAGTVGVVMVDGVVDRVVAPGERTSVSLFERLATFVTGRARTAFYLVDQRPFPVPYVVHTRPRGDGEVVKTQVLVTFSLPKGDRVALATFIDVVGGERASVSTSTLYDRLRPDVVRVAQHVLEREPSFPDAEAEIRRQLELSLAARYGLTVDVTLAPLTMVASLDLHLADLFTRDAQAVELDVVVRAQGQHEDFTAAKIAPAATAAIRAQLRRVDLATLDLHALERALAAPLAEALAPLGMTLLAVTVLDAVSAQLRRDEALGEADALVADRERRAPLADRDAALAVASVNRNAFVASTQDAAELTRRRVRRDAELDDRATRARLELELSTAVELAQVEKLRAMAALDRELADQEQAHVLARRAGLANLSPEQMVAMQAAELDPAWAAALSGERRHTDDLRAIFGEAMAAMARVAAPPLVQVKKEDK